MNSFINKGSEDMPNLGKLMKATRERKGFCQEEMAIRMKRGRSCISKFEHNRKIPDVDTFKKWFLETNSADVAVAYLQGKNEDEILKSIQEINLD